MEVGPKLEKPEDQHGNQCCPNLYPDGIRAGSNKGLDLEVLLQMLEEDLNLPTIFVDGRDRAGSELKVVRQEDVDLSCFRVLHLDPSQRVGASLDPLGTSKFDLFIFKHMPVLRNSFVSNDLVQRIVLHAGDKIDSLATPSAPEGIASIASIVNHDGSGGKMELRHDFHISYLPLRDDSKGGGRYHLMIEKQMEFDCSLRPSEMGTFNMAKHKSIVVESSPTHLFLNRNFFFPWTWF